MGCVGCVGCAGVGVGSLIAVPSMGGGRTQLTSDADSCLSSSIRCLGHHCVPLRFLFGTGQVCKDYLVTPHDINPWSNDTTTEEELNFNFTPMEADPRLAVFPHTGERNPTLCL